jgi:hypothetical protein
MITFLVCAELSERDKVNVELPFPSMPSTAALKEEITKVFTYELWQLTGGSHRLFEIESMTIYDDTLMQWVDFETQRQLHPYDQLYAFGVGIPPSQSHDSGLPPPRVSKFYQDPNAAAMVLDLMNRKTRAPTISQSNPTHQYSSGSSLPPHRMEDSRETFYDVRGHRQPERERERGQPAASIGRASSQRSSSESYEPIIPAAGSAYGRQAQGNSNHAANGSRTTSYNQSAADRGQGREENPSVLASSGMVNRGNQRLVTVQPVPVGRISQDVTQIFDIAVAVASQRPGDSHANQSRTLQPEDLAYFLNSLGLAVQREEIQSAFQLYASGAGTPTAYLGLGEFAAWTNAHPKTFEIISFRVQENELIAKQREAISNLRQERSSIEEKMRKLMQELSDLEGKARRNAEQIEDAEQLVAETQRRAQELSREETSIAEKEIRIANHKAQIEMEEQEFSQSAKQLELMRRRSHTSGATPANTPTSPAVVAVSQQQHNDVYSQSARTPNNPRQQSRQHA